MAASMYIVVQGDDPGYNIYVNGRSIARNEDALEKLSLTLGIKPLIEFFSADQNSMALLIEEGAGNPELATQLPPPQWYSAQDGLATIDRLILELEEHPAALGSETVYVREELKEYQTVLRKTADRDLRWHLAVSWR